jgi:hypothetical protein
VSDTFGASAPIAESFAVPDDFGDLRASQLHTSLGERLGAQAGEAFMGGARTLARTFQYGLAAGIQPPAEFGGVDETAAAELERRQPTPEIPIEDARARVKQEGLQFNLPDQPTIRGPVFDLMMQHARERREYDAAVSRGPQGFLPDALGFVTSIGAGMIDPVNAAAFSIPVIGEARYGMMLERAGDSLAARAAVRAGVGAVQGAAGTAVLQPADWWLHTLDGQDYTMADALRSIVLGAGMGAAAHAGLGVFGDLPGRVREDVVRASMADAIGGNLGRGGELLREAGKDDPRIAESVGEAGRAPGANVRADWQGLADARSPEDADLASLSHEAETVPEPASIDPDKAPTAAEAAAKEADSLLADILPRLSDDERAIFEDGLSRLDQDKAAQEQMIRDGAACLMGAVA